MNRSDVHRIFFGHQATMTSHQTRVYGSHRIKAINTNEPNIEKAQTALVVALSQALNPSTRSLHKVYFFVSEEHKDWLVAQATEMASSVTLRLRAQTNDVNKEATKRILHLLKRWLHSVSFGVPTEWMPSAPERWAAYGYTASDKIPSWVQSTLG